MFLKHRKKIWKNFQVWVPRNNSSKFIFVGFMKIGIFEKIHFFRIWANDEFLLGWVLTFKIGELDVINHSVYHITPITFSEPYLKSHKFSEKMILKICGFQISKTEIYRLITLIYGLDMSTRPKRPKVLPVNFMPLNSTYFFIPTNFSEKPHFFRFATDNFPMEEFFGMSSYEPESSSIVKYEFWRIFLIFIMWSYLP